MRNQHNLLVTRKATLENYTPISIVRVQVEKKYEGTNVTMIGYVYDKAPAKRPQYKAPVATRKQTRATLGSMMTTKQEDEATKAAKAVYKAAKGTIKVRHYDEAIEAQHWKEDHYAKAEGMGEDEIFADKLIPGPEALWLTEETRAAAAEQTVRMFGYGPDATKEWARVEAAEAAREAVEATFNWTPHVGLIQEKPVSDIHRGMGMDAEWPKCPLAQYVGERAANRKARIINKRATLGLPERNITPTMVARAVLAADGKRLKTLLERAFTTKGEDRKDAVSAIARKRGDLYFKVTRVLHGCAVLEVMDDGEAEDNLLRATTMIDTAAAMAARRTGANRWNPTVRGGYTIRYDMRGKEYSMSVNSITELREALHLAPHFIGILKREVVEVIDHKELRALCAKYEASIVGMERPLTKPNLVRRAEQALRNTINAAAWSGSSAEFWKTIVESSKARMEDAITEEGRGDLSDHWNGINKIALGNPNDKAADDRVYDGNGSERKTYKVGNIAISAMPTTLREKHALHKEVMDTWQERAEEAESLMEGLEKTLRAIYPYEDGDALVYKYKRGADGSFETITDLDEALLVDMRQAKGAADEAHSAKSWARMEREYERAMSKISEGMTAFDA
jgi:hypothetical protein